MGRCTHDIISVRTGAPLFCYRRWSDIADQAMYTDTPRIFFYCMRIFRCPQAAIQYNHLRSGLRVFHSAIAEERKS
ncbi:MAG: hypothetical protein Q4C47_00425 [Planctomycetia bacterium]|nr:hypothetical protein [Planctomycetia bacterium]